MINQTTIKREGRFLLVGLSLALAWVLSLASADFFARVEAKAFPVLGDVSLNGQEFKKFQQEGIYCDGSKAIASGYLSKLDRLIPPQASWDRMEIFLGTPDGRRSHDIYRRGDFLDAPEDPKSANRPSGVSDWKWRISLGCITSYPSWFAIAHHTPWHGLWDIKTVLGPSPLPVK